ncbi:electron transfer flavoprotein subunit beta/FixA family protein [Corynebacterium propinquum]|uniref:electron transfer flavoprotein subunit beta/FixA family protein n=1 Tax=Corynebacterium propinquum TaxID=43769 RepID=UPI002541F20D|nr:electron transfer flavoprotein subunit beta/FixA family protein [Corynebacterium propinquum]MDK4235356.1 electron transfer flavoprotein subunit beta/FixA family protein [Corynebacterium propinquum]
MRIAVLVKEVPDTNKQQELSLETGLLQRRDGEGGANMVLDEISERAVEAALRLREHDAGSLAGEITIEVISMAPEAALTSIRRALSMGADEAVHIHDDKLLGADLTVTAEVLAAALRQRDYDLIITGTHSSDGASGALPAMLAEHLDVVLLSHLTSLSLEPSESGSTTITASRNTAYAAQSLKASCPAVVSISEVFPDPRFPNFKAIMAGKKKPVTTFTLEELGVDAEDFSRPRAIMTAVQQAPAREAGTKINDEGDAAEKIVEYLESNKLI